jgi:hypothetical protein
MTRKTKVEKVAEATKPVMTTQIARHGAAFPVAASEVDTPDMSEELPAGTVRLLSLPDQKHPDYFRIVVQNCITAFTRLPNNKMALDYCRVSGKLRAMVLADEEYIQETRSIYAQQQLSEIDETERLASLAEDSGEEDEEYVNPRDKGKDTSKGKKRQAAVDRDMLSMRFKAAQLRRELLNEIKEQDTGELDAMYTFFVPVSEEELEKMDTVEIFAGSKDESGVLNELTGKQKELPPEGSVSLADEQDIDVEQEEDEEFLFDTNGDIIGLRGA